MSEGKNINQDNLTVTPDTLLLHIANMVGEEFVVISLEGWERIITTLNEYEEDDKLINVLNGLGIPVIPVILSKKEEKQEESRIIMPTDTPKDDSKIIIP